MELNFKVVYEIKEGNSWRSKNGVVIKSNIAEDELVECELAKSLVEHLKTKSATLDPDKLLLGFAEAQKRGIEENLEAMDNLTLRAKNVSESMQAELLKTFEDAEGKYKALEEKFEETNNLFANKIKSSIKKIEEDTSKVEEVMKKLTAIDDWKFSNLADALTKILSLVQEDKELVKLVLESKK